MSRATNRHTDQRFPSSRTFCTAVRETAHRLRLARRDGVPCRIEPLEPRLLLSGTEYLVNSLADIVDSDGVVTLREAMQAANDNSAVTDDVEPGSVDETDLITFDQPALEAEAGAGNPLVITLNGSQLEITGDLEIIGLGDDVLTIDANGGSRVLYVYGTDTEASLSGLTLTGGSAGGGGGIYNSDGTVTLTNTTVSGNTVSGGYYTGLGGGIYNNYGGTVTLTNTTVSANSTLGSYLSNDDGGGGIYSSGTLTLTNSTVSGNSTWTDDGTADGGGIYSTGGTTTLTNSTISGNSASGNTSTDSCGRGGGIYNYYSTLTLTDTTVSENAAWGDFAVGGGIHTSYSTLTLTKTTVSGNRASISGGGISNVSHPQPQPTVTLTNTTVSGNSVSYFGDAYVPSGGGISNKRGTMTLTNTTVSANTANGGNTVHGDDALGGGIYTSGMLTLTNTTVSGNTASDEGGGIYNDDFNDGTLIMHNSIVSLNTAETSGDNIYGSHGGSHNLIDIDPMFVRDPDPGSGDGGDLQLTAGSPAIDAGDNAMLPADIYDLDSDEDTTEPLPIDLAGNPRIGGAAVDIGAYEFQTDPPFSDIQADLSGVNGCCLAWGDYDCDGDLDLALAGNTGGVRVTKVYANDSGIFTDVLADLPGVGDGSLAWGDYDGDGDLDLALAGDTGGVRVTKVYANDSGIFTDVLADLPGVGDGSLAWGDYDNDGDLDLALAGHTGSQRIACIYGNDGTGGFAAVGAGLTGVDLCALSWGDCDNDGDLDLALAGYTGGQRTTRIYGNDGAGGFAPIGAGLVGVYYCSLSWGDYDSDGDLDLAVAGDTGTEGISRIYDNDGEGGFTALGTGLVGVCYCSLSWGDYDNDGDLDLAIAGYTGSERVTRIYDNDGAGGFAPIGAGLEAVSSCCLTWGDYDSDGDLDLALAGWTGAQRIARIYGNDASFANTYPTAPTGLSASVDASTVTLSWTAATDAETPPAGLSYNVRVGTSPGADDVFCSMAATDGWRRLPTLGNAQQRLSWSIGDLTRGTTYYWSVQAIDASFAGSPWAPEESLVLNRAPVARDGGPYVIHIGEDLVLDGNASFDPDQAYGDSIVSYEWDLDDDGEFDDAEGASPVVPWATLIALGWDAPDRGDVRLRVTDSLGATDSDHTTLTISRFMMDDAIDLPDVGYSSTAWGDYDSDGDLDLALTGAVWTGSEWLWIGGVYRNEDGSFASAEADLPGVDDGSIAWGDYDNDGDLDLAVAGSADGTYISRIYRNDAGAFTDIEAGLPGVAWGSLAWGDYDNDGDLDLVLAGYSASPDYDIARIYENDDGDFADIGAGLPGLTDCSLAWGDYDGDGDLDLALTGDSGHSYYLYIYRNELGEFAYVATGLPGVRYGSLAWGDYDNDGDLDLAVAGEEDDGSYLGRVYRNDEGTLTSSGAPVMTGVRHCCLAWGDYDNDGDLDLAMAGETTTQRVKRVYRNDDGSLANTGSSLPAVHYGSLAWGDYDNDGDLDLAVAGIADGGSISGVYRNDGQDWNTPPTAPTDLSAESAATAILSWLPAEDAETPQAGLSYNVRVGSSPGGDDVFCGMADPATGWRRVPALGNAQQALSWRLSDLPDGLYYWSVQAIDSAFAGSAWAPEQTFEIHPPFSDAGVSLPGVSYSSLAWGDYDNDGDLDLALSGSTGSERITRIYENVEGAFSDTEAPLDGIYAGSLAWGDYSNDDDLDLALAGYASSGRVCSVYENIEGAFSDAAVGLEGVSSGDLAWGDYDNDGDLDLALAGVSWGMFGNYDCIADVYRNDDGAFTAVGADLPEVRDCSLAWGDYDNDGDLDLALAGDSDSGGVSRIYRNDAGVLLDAGAGLPGVYDCCLAWGDYDSDGDLDLALAGVSGSVGIARVYRNDDGSFVDSGAALPGVWECCLAWGDYDSDGDLDLALAGDTGGQRISEIYRNDAGVLVPSLAGLPGVRRCSLAWGDYDNDGDLDLALAGDGDSGPSSRIYRNDIGVPNTPPTAPMSSIASVDDHSITLVWSAATDAETSQEGLSYNVRVGTSPGADDVFCGMADKSTGLRRLPALGNAQQRLSWTIDGLADGDYFWSVQAIDTAFAGSAWAPTAGPVLVGERLQDIEAGLRGMWKCSQAWGDYDSDGDLDLALAGDPGGMPIGRIYRNDGGTFVNSGAALPGVSECCLAWGDYDNDGDLDLAIAGDTGFGYLSRIYRNEAGTFVDIGAGLPGLWQCSLAWGDFDNDGDLDLALAGDTGSGYIGRVYRNDGGTFTDIEANLLQVRRCSVAWADHDNDGDLDLIIAGDTGEFEAATALYNNDGGVFTDSGVALPGVFLSALAWGDYDNDGDPDLAITGGLSGNQVGAIYRNDGGAFVDIGAGLQHVSCGSLAWGDFDNDGDLDLALTGLELSWYYSRIYRNNNGVFVDISADLPGVMKSSLAWGDYDNDGDLDLALAGTSNMFGLVSRIYRNDALAPNAAPTAPTGLNAVANGGELTLNWSAATDAETPQAGLTYNLRIGTSPGARDICSCMAQADGWRRLPAVGNAQQRLSWTIGDLPYGEYYWSVQAIDASYAGSAWAAEEGPVTLALPGDANGDGTVSDADYTIWADHYGQCGVSAAEGDFNGDGCVTDADYTIWADHYGATSGDAAGGEGLSNAEEAARSNGGYAAWANHYGTADSTSEMGDFNRDGAVTDGDYTIWADRYGEGTNAAAAQSPQSVMPRTSPGDYTLRDDTVGWMDDDSEEVDLLAMLSVPALV